MTLLLDASVWLAAADPDDRFHAASRTLLEAAARGERDLAALDLTLYEVANVSLARKESPSVADHRVRLVLAACGAAIERADVDLMAQAVAIGIEYEISAYDAAYVAAARQRGWTLVSGDVRDLVGNGLALAPDADLPD